MYRLHPIVWLAVVPVACTTILNIDGHYVVASNVKKPGDSGMPMPESGVVAAGGSKVEASGGVIVLGAGGSNAGGAASQAGATSSGGATGAGGTIGAGGSVVVTDCSQNACSSGLKCCGNTSSTMKACYSPSPLVGCSTTGCDRCTNAVPDFATAACVEGMCAFECIPGYTEKSGKCVAMGTGGTGSMDAGGPTGMGGKPCDPHSCTGCGPAGPFGCCTASGTCGCTYFDFPIGPTNIGYCLPRPENIFPPR